MQAGYQYKSVSDYYKIKKEKGEKRMARNESRLPS